MDVQDNLLDSNPHLAAFSCLSPHLHRLIVVLAAMALTLPCLVSGIPVDGDAVTHVQYQHEFSDQFWAGDLYPRWLMNSNKGYGSPTFLMQYPLPYWITAFLRPIVRFRSNPIRAARELGVFCFLALAAAGLGTRFWLGKRFGPLTATTVAIAYISFPYILSFEIYRSAAIGQLSASACMPLVMAACESLRLKLRPVSILGMVFGLLVMSNLITSVLFLPLMIGYTIACRESCCRSLRRCLLSLFISLALGFGIVAVYLFPLIAYRDLFDLSVWARLTPSYFSFVRGASLEVPLVAIALGGTAIITGVAAYCVWRAPRSLAWRACMLLPLGAGAFMAVPGAGLSLIRASGLTSPILDIGRGYHPENMLVIALSSLALGMLAYCSVPKEWLRWQEHILLVAACISFVLMSPWSAFSWSAMPTLAAAVQFPHRFGAILTLALAGLFAAAVESGLCRRPRHEGVHCLAIVTSVALMAIVFGGLAWKTEWRWTRGLRNRVAYAYDESLDVDWMYLSYVPPDHLPAVSKLLGVAPSYDRVERTPIAEGDAELVAASGTVNVVSRHPRQVIVSYFVSRKSVMRTAQLYSPLWKGVLLDQKSGTLSPRSSDEGLLDLTLVPGRHYLRLFFEIGGPERYGEIVTIVSLVIVVGGILFEFCAKDRTRQKGEESFDR